MTDTFHEIVSISRVTCDCLSAPRVKRGVGGDLSHVRAFRAKSSEATA